MKRRIMALCLTATMIISSLSMTAWADEADTFAETEIEATENTIETEALIETETLIETEAPIETETLIETEVPIETEAPTETEKEDLPDDVVEDSFSLMESSGLKKPVNGVYDCIWFGSYPQAEVVASQADADSFLYSSIVSKTDFIIDSSLYEQLRNADWKIDETTMINGDKYLRFHSASASYVTFGNSSYYNWEYASQYHYFKFEPIKWRVIDIAANGSVKIMADKILDDKPFNKASDTETSWSACSLREWLGTSFLNSAFSPNEQTALRSTNIDPPKNLADDGIYQGNLTAGQATTDYVFILDRSSARFESCGFIQDINTKDPAKRCVSTTFAKAMGVSTLLENGKPYSPWWLRNPGTNLKLAETVTTSGLINYMGLEADNCKMGVRPVVYIDPSIPVYANAGTVSVTGLVSEIAPPCNHVFSYFGTVFKASPDADGRRPTRCSKCGLRSQTIISRPVSVTAADSVFNQGTEVQTSVKVVDAEGETINARNYTLTYKNNTTVGTATVDITFKGNYYRGTMSTTFDILPAPVTDLKAESAGKNKVQLSWSASEGAAGYLLYYKTGSTGTYTFLGMTSGLTYTDTKASDEDYNFYWVYPYFKNVDNKIKANTKNATYTFGKGVCPAVTNLKAASITGGVKLTWTGSADAEGYLIYGIRPEHAYGYIGMTTTGTTFTDKSASKADWNYYWVFPYHKNADGKMMVGGTAKYVYGKAR